MAEALRIQNKAFEQDDRLDSQLTNSRAICTFSHSEQAHESGKDTRTCQNQRHARHKGMPATRQGLTLHACMILHILIMLHPTTCVSLVSRHVCHWCVKTRYTITAARTFSLISNQQEVSCVSLCTHEQGCKRIQQFHVCHYAHTNERGGKRIHEQDGKRIHEQGGKRTHKRGGKRITALQHTSTRVDIKERRGARGHTFRPSSLQC